MKVFLHYLVKYYIQPIMVFYAQTRWAYTSWTVCRITNIRCIKSKNRLKHKFKICDLFDTQSSGVQFSCSQPCFIGYFWQCILMMSADNRVVSADTAAGVWETVSDEHARDDQRAESTGAPAARRILTVRRELITDTLVSRPVLYS